jgi:prepilin-type N-terminal cleavage/methylation domain-containing protein
MREPKTKILEDACVNRWREDRGVGLLEMIVVVAIISILSTFAVIGIRNARASIHLQNSLRLLAGNVEKARIHAIRRHSYAKLEFTSNNTYTLTMDFNGTGNDDTVRSYRLEGNVIITQANGTAMTADDLPLIDFDWRGRTTQCFTTIRMQNSIGESSRLAVTSSGDITVNSNLGETVTPGSYSNVNLTSDVAAGATVSGSNPAYTINPCGGSGSTSASGTPPPSSPPPGCSVFNVNKSTISIKRNGGSTDSFTVTATTAADTIKVVQTDGRTNLEFLPSPTQSIAASSSKTFSVKSKNNSRGEFPIRFISACSASNYVSATVKVTN